MNKEFEIGVVCYLASDLNREFPMTVIGYRDSFPKTEISVTWLDKTGQQKFYSFPKIALKIHEDGTI